MPPTGWTEPNAALDAPCQRFVYILQFVVRSQDQLGPPLRDGLDHLLPSTGALMVQMVWSCMSETRRQR